MIRILLFAGLAEKVGKPELNVEQDKLTVPELIAWLVNEYPALEEEIARAMVAVNEEFVEEDSVIKANDIVAIIPPVSGG